MSYIVGPVPAFQCFLIIYHFPLNKQHSGLMVCYSVLKFVQRHGRTGGKVIVFISFLSLITKCSTNKLTNTPPLNTSETLVLNRILSLHFATWFFGNWSGPTRVLGIRYLEPLNFFVRIGLQSIFFSLDFRYSVYRHE